MSTLQKIAFSLAMSLGLLSPVLVLAQGVGVDVNAQAGGAGVSASTSVRLGAAEERAKDRGNQEIDRRVQALTQLNTRIQGVQLITEQFKTSINTAVQNQITAFTQLKAKINADSDAATLRTDIKSVTDSYRIFALVIPQGHIAAAADRLVVVGSMMSTVGAKLQARIQAAATAGADVTALNATLTDLIAKLNDIQTKAQAAITVSAVLTPDEGDKTKMQANTKALQEARADIVAGIKSINDARKDIDTIIRGLRSLQVNASSTTQVQTQTP